MVECLLGFQCDGFVMLAADQTSTPHIIVMKSDADKLHEVDDGLLMGVIGDPAAAVQYTQFVSTNYRLYKLRNNYNLGTTAAVHFARKSLNDMKVLPETNSTEPACGIAMLIAGYDEKYGSQLYQLDCLGSCLKVPVAVLGHGGILSRSILDYYHKSSLTIETAYEILKVCVREIHQRLFISLPSFKVKTICRDGVHELPPITRESFH